MEKGATTSRRSVIGGIASLSLLTEMGHGAAAAEGRKIYGVYTGKDMKSYLCELKLAEHGAVIPTYEIAAPGGPGLPVDGSWQDFHKSFVFGSMTILLAGELEIGVTGGTMRSVLGKAGDVFILIDTQGDGHSAMRKSKVDIVMANPRFNTSADGLWPALAKGFIGWPDNVLPPAEYTPYAPYISGGHPDPSRRKSR